jgi:hypothetical protein
MSTKYLHAEEMSKAKSGINAESKKNPIYRTYLIFEHHETGPLCNCIFRHTKLTAKILFGSIFPKESNAQKKECGSLCYAIIDLNIHVDGCLQITPHILTRLGS